MVLAAAGNSLSDQPGTLGFLVVFGMAVILYFLFRSMAKHLRRVNTAARAEASSARASDAGPVPPGSASAAPAAGPEGAEPPR
jgi:hypothetical protein